MDRQQDSLIGKPKARRMISHGRSAALKKRPLQVSLPMSTTLRVSIQSFYEPTIWFAILYPSKTWAAAAAESSHRYDVSALTWSERTHVIHRRDVCGMKTGRCSMKFLVNSPRSRLMLGGINSVAHATLELPITSCTFEELDTSQNLQITNDDLYSIPQNILDQSHLFDMRIFFPCFKFQMSFWAACDFS